MELIVSSVVAFLAAGFGAWVGSKLAAKQGERSQREFLSKLNDTNQSLAAIARRMPGGQGNAMVQQPKSPN